MEDFHQRLPIPAAPYYSGELRVHPGDHDKIGIIVGFDIGEDGVPEIIVDFGDAQPVMRRYIDFPRPTPEQTAAYHAARSGQ